MIAVDVGNNTYSFGRYFECKPGQHVLMSGYLGSIGFGFPAAMGAWAAAPDRTILAVTGDGGFGQYLAEITTAVKYEMNITHVLLNNSQLGKISKEQRAGEWDVWQTSLHNPDFAAYAELCGADGARVTRHRRARRRAQRRVRLQRTCTHRRRHRPGPHLRRLTLLSRFPGVRSPQEPRPGAELSWWVVTDDLPITSSATTAAMTAGTTNPGRPVVSATNMIAARGTR